MSYACRLDYCNSLLYGVTDSLFSHLQPQRNVSARLFASIGSCWISLIHGSQQYTGRAAAKCQDGVYPLTRDQKHGACCSLTRRAGADHPDPPPIGGMALSRCKGGPERKEGFIGSENQRIKGHMQIKTTIVVQEGDD